MISIESEAIVARVDERNGDIVFVGRPNGTNRLFFQDWVSPAAGPGYGSAAMDWLSTYRGGWQELIPNPGNDSEWGGVALPFHGDVRYASWEVVDRSPTSVSLRVPTRLPIILERSMSVEGEVLRLEERLVSDAPIDVPFAWTHHPAFDAPPGTKIDLPPARIAADSAMIGDLVDVVAGSIGTWPELPAVDGGVIDLSVIDERSVERLVFASELKGHWAAVRHPDGYTIAMAWDPETFPNLWVWWQIGGSGFPWFGRSRLVAIEPSTTSDSSGLAPAIERGEHLMLSAGGSWSTWLTMTLVEGRNRVVNVTRDGHVSSARI
ncbi:MAG: hypothetical protein IIC71_13875 [Acidobacteria bacterium]|nr:hypothetical protein [Acidobacteriota bacterium]